MLPRERRERTQLQTPYSVRIAETRLEILQRPARRPARRPRTRPPRAMLTSTFLHDVSCPLSLFAVTHAECRTDLFNTSYWVHPLFSWCFALT